MLHTGTVGFETGRLICRRFVPDDVDAALRNWAADPMVQHEYGEPVYENTEKVQALLEGYIDAYRNDSYYRWAVVEKESGECIGQIAVCRVYDDIAAAEIEYCLGRKFWGRGYASEALGGVIRFAFVNTGFRKLEAYHRQANVRSGRVLEKSVMHIADNVERFARMNMAPHDEDCYCITKEEYRSMI